MTIIKLTWIILVMISEFFYWKLENYEIFYHKVFHLILELLFEFSFESFFKNNDKSLISYANRSIYSS